MITPTAPLPSSTDPNYIGLIPNAMTTTEERMQKFAEIAARYEISNESASRLWQLEGYEIVFLCDDSGSMGTAVGDTDNAFAEHSTRWDELKQIVSTTVDISSVLDPDGLDIYFLNRPPMLRVKHSSELIPTFDSPPKGLTPITRVLRQILQAKQNEILERKLLIIIATDGQPTDDYGKTDIGTLERVLKYERKAADRILITFCACTDDDQAVGYLNRWDETIPYLDVCDDYRSERKEAWRVQGRQVPFSFGDYVVKILLSSIDRYFDNLDQKLIDSQKATACCSLM
ncbi:unnamed protein product [Rotaria magnacalcarata]|uniref:VWFA domain-containing protein n=1 Tax=Rotaria magnacalcarata TaxID=392030 RepID=A0A815ANW7_9BILA|nr:unnamed protein product [Rotaria magnacalcarata]CAF1509392.1 unnamed protein product [Rotaria magnacalcarata]CAF2033349.1 unnamed protein product [Rotaria magnacalcarata]CAF2059244.1 unnamed protein product [Rotaria magnacalcarata]CAF2129454.1 unnamed protein product [Rotaria magnacalcarata]